MNYTQVAAALTLAIPLAANALTVDGKEWRQVVDTVGISWSQVAAVCSPGTGVCDGKVGDISFTGWTWASVDDIRALFDHLILPESIQFPTSDSSWGEFYTHNIGAVIDEKVLINTYTHAPSIFEGVFGLSRSDYLDGNISYALSPSLYNYFLDGAGDGASLFRFSGKDSIADWLGVWLYRNAVPISEPGTYALILAGFGLLCLFPQRTNFKRASESASNAPG
jgi:hypothetical protein